MFRWAGLPSFACGVDDGVDRDGGEEGDSGSGEDREGAAGRDGEGRGDEEEGVACDLE